MRTLTGGAIAMLVVLAVVAACGDNGSTSSRTPSCDNLASLDTYRYTLSIKLDSPAFVDEQSQPSDAPLIAFGDALTALFSDLRMEGAHVAPDRTQVTLEFEGEELEWRSIGDRNWIRLGDEWDEPEGYSADELITPEVVCEDIVADLSDSIAGARAREETVNGVDSYYYSLGRGDIAEIPELLGGASLTDVPQEMEIGIWLAKDGLWPVKVSFEATDEDEEGRPIELALDMELSDVNDEEIEIEAPEFDAE